MCTSENMNSFIYWTKSICRQIVNVESSITIIRVTAKHRKHRTNLMDKLLCGLTNVHTSNTDYILKNNQQSIKSVLHYYSSTHFLIIYHSTHYLWVLWILFDFWNIMWKSNKKLKLKEKLDWSVSSDNILTDYLL